MRDAVVEGQLRDSFVRHTDSLCSHDHRDVVVETRKPIVDAMIDSLELDVNLQGNIAPVGRGSLLHPHDEKILRRDAKLDIASGLDTRVFW